uniref:Uncharacterized protein n=1 Tax=Steinernema glaseri TaxID=37863 RepID=A0A1I8AQ06_9BILA
MDVYLRSEDESGTSGNRCVMAMELPPNDGRVALDSTQDSFRKYRLNKKRDRTLTIETEVGVNSLAIANPTFCSPH